MSDERIRSLERSFDPADLDRRRAQLVRSGRAGEAGSEWVASLTKSECLLVAASAGEDVARGVDDLRDAVLRIDAGAFWVDVVTAAVSAARVRAAQEWIGPEKVFHAHAVLGCDRAATRRALGLERMPSFAPMRVAGADRLPLAAWEAMCAFRRAMRERNREEAA